MLAGVGAALVVAGVLILAGVGVALISAGVLVLAGVVLLYPGGNG